MVVAPIGDDPAGVLVPPAEIDGRPLRAVVVQRRLALIHVPVELRRNRLLGERTALGRIVRQGHPDLLQLADSPVANQFDGRLKLLEAPLHRADLNDAAGLFDHFAQQLALVDGERHRFFGIDVFARLAGGDGDGRVPMVGRGVGHHVDALVVEQFAVILVDRRFSAESLLGSFRMFQIDVADGHDVAEAGGLAGNVGALAADADQANVWTVVFRLRLIGDGILAGKPVRHDGPCGSQRGGRTKKISTVRGRLGHGKAPLQGWRQGKQRPKRTFCSPFSQRKVGARTAGGNISIMAAAQQVVQHRIRYSSSGRPTSICDQSISPSSFRISANARLASSRSERRTTI